MAGGLQPPSFKAFMDRVRSTKGQAGKGIDQLSRDFVTSLDEKGQKQLHKILGTMFELVVVPTQCLTALVALLPKSATAFRPIALLHMLYRWYMKPMRPAIAKWDRDNAGPWDSAVAGKGAEEAAFAEECTTELLLLGGAHTAGVLLDMEKFCDHCSLGMLLAVGLAMGFLNSSMRAQDCLQDMQRL